MPFYRKSDNKLINQDIVYIQIRDDNKDNFVYPLAGWHWFPNEAAAKHELNAEHDAMMKEVRGRS